MGWGVFPHGDAYVYTPHSLPDLQQFIQSRPANRKILAFGSSRSYGDAGFCSNEFALSMRGLSLVHQFDKIAGTIVVEAGITLEEIIAVALPYGWFLPVTPGTRFPTLGGSFAADVHGKNHHQAGTISNFVDWFDIVLADGTLRHCSRTENADLFRATAGGMGLTGVVYRIQLRLVPVETSFIIAEYYRTANLSETMSILAANDQEWNFTVAWVDCIASGKKMGRSEVSLGRHALLSELPQSLRANPLQIDEKPPFTFPFQPPFSFVNSFTGELFNTAFYYKSGPGKKHRKVVPYNSFFYPLDIMHHWNRVYGPQGFVQYQFIVPFTDSEVVIAEVLRHCIKRKHPSTLAVLKRCGEAAGLLSFPKPGWLMAMDFPVTAGLFETLDDLDNIILAAGGREYLAKDVRMKPETFRAMYPELPEWQAIKRKYDPDLVFCSDQARRLQLL